RYAETPPYLRRHLFKKTALLRYAGVLPPLRMPHHMVTPSLEEGQYREGVVQRHNGLTDVGSDVSVWVDVGATSPVPMAESMPFGTRITVRIYSRDGLFWCTPERSRTYWGYRTTASPSLHRPCADADLAIITSVEGEGMEEGSLSLLGERLSGNVLVVFGSPDRGVGSILNDEGHSISEYSSVVANTVPNQGTATVRTEEAVYATLALLNVADIPPR
ncbi:MAG: putative RNA uridine N3 methyltransferase, partial [Methanomicrobiaceae archaeon]|nr:putative RNA uridine N3 methyltransferase [Methanomicrobiaceae archaeon]